MENKPFFTLTALPRPDFPSERESILLRADLVADVQMGDFNYTPADTAPVALLPNARQLKGRAPIVTTVYGKSFVVKEDIAEIHRRMQAAERGDVPVFDEHKQKALAEL